MVQVIFPFSNVPLLAILRLESSETVSLVPRPVTFVCVSVWAPELPFTIRLVAEPLTFVFGTVGPVLHTVGALFAFFIDIACVEGVFNHFNVLNILQTVLVNHLAKFLNLVTRAAVESFEVGLTRGVQFSLCPQTRLEMFLLLRLLLLVAMMLLARCLIKWLLYFLVLTKTLLELHLAEHFARLLHQGGSLVLLGILSSKVTDAVMLTPFGHLWRAVHIAAALIDLPLKVLYRHLLHFECVLQFLRRVNLLRLMLLV